jgi:hypothetical protein
MGKKTIEADGYGKLGRNFCDDFKFDLKMALKII